MRTLTFPILLLTLLPLLAGCSKSPTTTGNTDAGTARAKRDVQVLSGVISKFFVDTGRYPTNAEGLNALMTKPADLKEWSQYLDKLPNDPWNQPYHYAYPGKHNPKTFDVYSSGPDQKEGTADDIGNW